jgi:DME family drug/metabolite transporter
MNICMKLLAANGCNPSWAIFNRELIAVVVLGPWLVAQWLRGRPSLPGGGALWRLLGVGLLVEAVGNVCQQWSLGIVGLAITVPTTFGAMIVGGAVLGRVLLGERISPRAAAAASMLLASLGFLGLGAGGAARAIAAGEALTRTPLTVALAVGATCLAGAIYSLLSVTIRHGVTRETTPTAVGFLVPGMAIITLGPWCAWELGYQVVLDTSLRQWILMYAGGAFNLIGFLALIYGLQRITVLYANAVNASQVAIAAVAGVFIFGESANSWVVLGTLLTVLGIVCFDHRAAAAEEILPP